MHVSCRVYLILPGLIALTVFLAHAYMYINHFVANSSN
jgi:hypothetical protein